MDQSDKRQQIANEILRVLAEYVTQLDAGLNAFYKPLVNDFGGSKCGIRQNTINLLFRNLVLILEIAYTFHQELQKSLQDWSTATCIGELLEQTSHFNKIKEYAVGHDEALSSLERLCAGPRTIEPYRKFTTFLDQCTNNSNVSSFSDILMLPLKWIEQYVNLLSQLKNHTPPDHPDQLLIEMAYKNALLTSDKICQIVREAESKRHIDELQKEFIELDHHIWSNKKEQKFLLKKGYLMQVCEEQDQKLMFYLFNDIIICCSNQPEMWKFKVREIIHIDRNFEVVDMEHSDGTTNESGQKIYSWEIQFISCKQRKGKGKKRKKENKQNEKKEEKKSIIVYCHDKTQKSEWMVHLNQHVTSSACEIVPLEEDQKDITCLTCSESFTISKRIHLCRQCGGTICDRCAIYRVVGQSDNFLYIRICSKCFDDILPARWNNLFLSKHVVEEIPQEPLDPDKSNQGRLTLEVEYRQFIDSYEEIRRQIANGIYASHRVASFLQKICLQKQQHSKGVIEASKTFKKNDKLSKYKDNMARYPEAVEGILQTFDEIAEKEQLFCEMVTTQLVTKINKWIKSMEARLKTILQEEKNLSAKIKILQTNVRNTRQKCQHMIQLLKQMDEKDRIAIEKKKENEKSPKSTKSRTFKKKLKGLSTKMSTLTLGNINDIREKTYTAAVNFQKLLKETNYQQKLFFEDDFPRILDQLQKLEHERLAKMKAFMGEFAIIYRQFIRPSDNQKIVIQNFCDQMNAKDDVDDFIDKMLSQHGLWIMPEMYSYDLLLTPGNIKDNELHCKTVFGIPINDLMDIQKHSHPRAKMPLVVPALCKVIKDSGGTKTKNIFKENASFEERRKLKVQLNSGDYNLNVTDPHIAATVLKDWLRELPVSLFPSELYDEIIELGGRKEIQSIDTMMIFNKVPVYNQNIFIELSLLMRKIFDNVVHTKMSKEMLAIVLANVLLRPPNTKKKITANDTHGMLEKSKLERRFIYYALSIDFVF